MMFTLVPTAWAEGTEAGTASVPELENPATSGTSGGIDWKVEGGTLTITPSSSPKDGCNSGQMVENYGTLTPVDPDYIAALTAAGYIPGSNGHFYYPGTETWVSDSPWKFLSEQITSVVVEDGVTSIAARAFRLPNVTEVSIPASVKSIGNLVFEACEKLVTVNWTGNWKGHGPMAFNGFSRCSSLGEGHELTDWMPACFYVNADSDSIEGTQFTVDFDKLNKRLQNETTTYPLAMFRSVPKITSATLTSQLNVKYIFEYSGIHSVKIEVDQPSIAEAAFRGCKGLTSVTIPASVTVIHTRAFADSGLKNITFSGLNSPTFGSFAFENVKLDSVTLNENMSVTEAVKIIGKLTKDKAITDSTKIIPAKFANFNAEDVVVDGAEGEAINNQSYPFVKNLTINGAYTSASDAFGYHVWGQGTLKNLTIQAPGENVTIKATAFLRTPLKSVKIEAKELKFTGDAAFLNTMYLTHIDLTGVDEITLDAGGKRTFAIDPYQNGSLSAPTRYVYFKDADAYTAMNSQFGGNASTYYLVTNGGTVVGEQDGFSAVIKSGYTATWHEKPDFSDDAVETAVAGKVYYADWSEKDVTITFVDGENGNTVGSITKKFGEAINDSDKPSTDPTKTGYTFAGWDEEIPNTMPAENMTITAQWTPNTYKVIAKMWLDGKVYYYDKVNQKTFSVTGEFGKPIDFETIKAQAIETAKSARSAATYEAKIYEEHEPNTVCTTYGEHQSNQQNHYLKVKVTTTQKVVVYGLVNDEETTIWSGTAPTGSNVVDFLNANVAEKLDKIGYTHTEWYKYDSVKHDNFAADDTVNGWTNVLVKYTPNTYKVSFDANGGKGTMPVQDFTYDVEQLLSENTFTRANYTFSGWSTAKNGVKAYDDQQNVENLTADNKGMVTLYAVWTAKSTVDEFDGAVQSYTYDGTIKSYVVNSELKGFNVSYQQNGQTVTPKNVGTYNVVITRNEDDTYASFNQTITGGVVINPADFPVSITANRTSMTGSGTVTLTVNCPEDVVVSGVTCSDDSIEVTTNANGTYSAYLPNVTKAYTFTVKIASGLDNYSDGLATCTVSVTRRHTSSVTPGNTVSVPSTPNGTVTVNPSTASKGETVTITTKPSEGYELGSIEVLDKNGDSLKLKDLGNGKYSFVMPDGKVSVEASFVKAASTSFVDVPANAYFADAVNWAVDKGVTNGLSDTMFGPYESCTRAQIVTFLWRAAGSPEPKAMSSFSDVPASAYYAKAVAWAVENGITNGMTETTFAPDATCTRGQSVTFLHRALKGTASGSVNFTDVPANAFYADAVNWAVASDVTNGTSNTTFSPNADCTRAEIVTFLYRAYQGK